MPFAGFDQRPYLDGPARAIGLRQVTESFIMAPIVSGVLTINLMRATIHRIPLSANITSIVLLGRRPGRVHNALLHFVADGTLRTITWSPIIWPGGAPPTMTSTNGKKDEVAIVNPEGDGVFQAFIGGQNF